MAGFLDTARAARELGGKPLLRQLTEALVGRLRHKPLGMSEYFEYGLWRTEITRAKQVEFIGWRQSADLDRLLNAQHSRVLANDKLICYTLLQQHSLAMPQPIATYTLEGRSVGNEVVLQRLTAVREFLMRDVYPFYVKPISAGYGQGVLGVATREGECLRLMDDTLLPIDEFLSAFDFAPYGGMLFQRPVTAHPEVTAVTGTAAVSCVRCICFVTPSGPQIHTAFWKITTGNNMLDNFSHGDYGNCLGSVNVATGVVERVIQRMGPGGEISEHPDTHLPLVGFQLPNWADAKELVARASIHFPGLRLQNWDVALSPKGPVLIELNTESELAVPQAISGRGLRDTRLENILSRPCKIPLRLAEVADPM